MLNTSDFNSLQWFDYYNLFHFNVIPVLLMLWLSVISVCRLHDHNLNGWHLFLPGFNFMKLFSHGDANENNYGLPNNVSTHNNFTYFDEIGKGKFNKRVSPIKSGLVLIFLSSSIGVFFYFQNTDIIIYNQLVTEDEISKKNDPLTNSFDIPEVFSNPIKNRKLNGKVKVLSYELEGNVSHYIFNNKGNLIKYLDSYGSEIYHYSNNKLDSIVDDNSVTSEYKYENTNDTIIIKKCYSKNNLNFTFLNKVLIITNKFKSLNFQSINDEGSFYSYASHLAYDNFNRPSSYQIDETFDDVVSSKFNSFKYDIDNNLIEDNFTHGNYERTTIYSYDNKNRLKSVENMSSSLSYGYRGKHRILIDDNNSGDFFRIEKSNIIYSSDNNPELDEVIELLYDEKNNLIEVPVNNISHELLRFNYDKRRYGYYSTYFHLYLDFF
ncbi:MAG: hypothetical protein ACPG6V_07860 [Flavobacteriales bacterium]